MGFSRFSRFYQLLRWEGISVAVMELEWASMLEYYFIATGFALCLLVSYNFFAKMDIEEESEKLQEKRDKTIEQIGAKKQRVRWESSAEFYSKE
ncbi:MAG: hypothetical protein L0Y61_04935, partial [Epsilonproteobacteria bacterium]|nr:hypothetical protein [Campylobacterota bacterium]